MRTKDFVKKYRSNMYGVVNNDIIIIFPEEAIGLEISTPYQEWEDDFGLPKVYRPEQGYPIDNLELDDGVVVAVAGPAPFYIHSVYIWGSDIIAVADDNLPETAYFHFAEPYFPVATGELVDVSIFIETSGDYLPQGFGVGESRGGCYVAFPNKTSVSNWVVAPDAFVKTDPNGMFSVYERGWLRPLQKLISPALIQTRTKEV